MMALAVNISYDNSRYSNAYEGGGGSGATLGIIAPPFPWG